MNRRARPRGRNWAIVPVVASVLLSAASFAAAQSEEGRFPTNLALLDRLTAEAVEEVLTGLDLPADVTILVVPDGYNEGNEFVASAFARALARRGFSVRKLTDASPAPAKQEQAPKTPPPGTVPPPGHPKEIPLDQDQEVDDDRALDESEDLFSADSTGADADSVGLDDPFSDETTNADRPEDRPDWLPDPEENAAESAQGVPAAPVPTASRVYPDGPVLEFKVLEFGVSYPTVNRPFLFMGRTSVHRLAGVYLRGSHLLGPEGTILEVASGQSHWQDRLSGSSRSLAEGASYPFRAPEVPPSRLGRYIEPVVVVGIIGSLVYLFYQNQN